MYTPHPVRIMHLGLEVWAIVVSVLGLVLFAVVFALNALGS